MPIAVYFRCVAGTQYRVYDAAFERGVAEIRPVADPAATSRIFVPNGGMNRSYTFKESDRRFLAEEVLEQQLRDSSYVATESFGSGAKTQGAGPR